jgi:WD40 repeat protein
VWAIKYSPQGDKFASGGNGDIIRVWSKDGGLLIEIEEHNGAVTSLCWFTAVFKNNGIGLFFLCASEFGQSAYLRCAKPESQTTITTTMSYTRGISETPSEGSDIVITESDDEHDQLLSDSLRTDPKPGEVPRSI